MTTAAGEWGVDTQAAAAGAEAAQAGLVAGLVSGFLLELVAVH